MTQLTQSEVDAYRDHGYLLLRAGIQPEDLASVRRLIMQFVDRYARRLYRAGKISSLHEDESFERRMAVINEESKVEAGNWDLTTATDFPELFQLVCHPVILESVEALLGPEIAWTGSYVTRLKMPQHERTAIPWHQDSQ